MDMALTRVVQVPGRTEIVDSIPVCDQYRAELGTMPGTEPQYAFGVYNAGTLARNLGLRGITAIEFGVAGGNGLVALERIAQEVARHLSIEIAVYGFDTGEGMPDPADYRDLPYVWSRGFYQNGSHGAGRLD